MRDDLNDSITDEEVIEMLAQHLITKPVFDALFSGYSFASNNPVSKGMQNILDLLNEHRLDKEADTLEKFYDSVRRRAEGIDKAEGKQKIVVELYDKFFRNAFPRMTERLGIVYTPVEVVDFIIHSVNDILQEEFGQTLGSKGVHILDPFVGTGTFITRLMQSGLITPEQLPHKYKHEIHANEIVLLAYYIAAINIESVYHSIMSDKALAVGATPPAYVPFDGICLTDTFQMYEGNDMLDAFFPDNSERRKKQKKLDIRVIVGNPPYSAGQESANDNNQNVSYAKLDNRIRQTYAANSSATLKNALYDSYLRAIRWGSDRLGDSGIIGFVTNAGFLEANTADGVRKCLAEEFDKIYVFHLRGNQRTSGEHSRKEGGKIFGSGSRAPIAITFLVKNAAKAATESAIIQWYDIGDYLTREEKLSIVDQYASVNGIRSQKKWVSIEQDRHFDWISQRDDTFDNFFSIAGRDAEGLFHVYSGGMKSGRDAWACNMSRASVENNMRRMIEVYNRLVDSNREEPDNDPSKISWTRALRNDLTRSKHHDFVPAHVVKSVYRPFTKVWAYLDRNLNDLVSKMPRMFPYDSAKTNVAISVSGVGAKSFSCILVDELPGYDMIEKGQHFPITIYTETTIDPNLFGDVQEVSSVNTITHCGIAHFRNHFSKQTHDSITNESVFYYIYGLLHSPDYRTRYADNLSKELPRIPAVKKFEDFQAFSKAGRDLAHWHLNYETVECYPVQFDLTGSIGKLSALKPEQFRVVKMKHPKLKDPVTGKSVNDKSTVIYNETITVTGIPLEAYDYVVNGKSAIDWVMERQAVTTDKDSGIVNDANLWATETMNNPSYPLELLQRVITVSLETMKIVNSLPTLDID